MELNLQLLQVGTKVKYATLCEAFGVEKKAGKSKQLQMKDFERYIKLGKEGTWFEVLEIYEEVKEKVDGRGKSENSAKALEENRHEQESFFTPDELQLALLWTLGFQAYEKNAKETVFTTHIAQNELFVAVGLCNEYFHMLSRQKYYYTKQNKDDERDTVYNLWQVNVAYDKIYSDMRNKTITAFNQLQRKKLLNFSHWKTWTNSKGTHSFSEEQMAKFLGKRQDVFEWWNETYPRKKCSNIGDVYTKLSPKEVKEFEGKLIDLLDTDEVFKGIRYYTSCFKVMYDIRTIKNELKKRGFEVGTTKEDFMKAYEMNMKDVVERINNKFLQRHSEFIDKKRDEHFQKFEEYENKMTVYLQENEGRKRTFGRVASKEPKRPYCDLIDNANYQETREILQLGIKHELDMEQYYSIQGIKHTIEKNNPEYQNQD